MEIKLLDCTLRDGGYVNEWKFGSSRIHYMLQRFIKAKMDIVEIGFLDERREFDKDRTIFPNTESLNKVYGEVDKQNTTLVAMIDYGTCGIENIQNQSETLIDGIRVIFKKPNMYKAIEFGKQLQEKGYLLSLQLVSVTSYEDRDILDFCDAANKIMPYAVSIVDTYGLMHKDKAKHYFELLNHNLAPEIAIGYHSHNNFQLAYANTIELLDMKTDRTLILDGSAYGMGKSAGNAPVELLAMHLNENYGKEYDINHLLEIIDTCVMPIYNQKRWGYEVLYFLAASNNCHPSYIEYLLDKKTLSVKAINKIVGEIEPQKQLNYDKDYIKELYTKYQSQKYEDTAAIDSLKEKYNGKDVLLVLPGKSATTEKDKVVEYINANEVETIAVNFIPEEYTVNTVFVGNSKRYGMMQDQIRNMEHKSLLITSSNVTSLNKEFDYMINIERIMDTREDIVDNSAAMIINLMRLVGAKSMTFAGFDGYGEHLEDAYCEECISISDDRERLERVNAQMKDKIQELAGEMPISFLTPSMYEVK